MKRLIEKVVESVRRLWRFWFYRKYVLCIFVAEIPDRLNERRIYLIGDDSEPWSAALLCPCRCGAVIQLSLLSSDSPTWRLSIDDVGLPTLSPSIWRTTGCRSHFYLRSGLIVWYRHDRKL